jgi:hypothetical protein
VPFESHAYGTAQSAAEMHCGLHAPSAHAYGAQGVSWPVGSRTELPLHVVAFMHVAEAFAGPHVPSSVPDCLPAAEQATHVSLHAPSQQTPSTQKPLAHSAQPAPLQSAPAAVLHGAPRGFRARQCAEASQ